MGRGLGALDFKAGDALGLGDLLGQGVAVIAPRAVASLIATSKLNGLAPKAYLRRVLERVADNPINRAAELLPCNLPSDTEAAAA